MARLRKWRGIMSYPAKFCVFIRLSVRQRFIIVSVPPRLHRLRDLHQIW